MRGSCPWLKFNVIKRLKAKNDDDYDCDSVHQSEHTSVVSFPLQLSVSRVLHTMKERDREQRAVIKHMW